MAKIIFTIIFTYFFTKFMTIVFSEEYADFHKKEVVHYVVTQKDGAVACLTENIYKKIQDFYKKNDVKSIKNEIINKNCFILKYLEELEAIEGICDNKKDKNQIKSFKSHKFLLDRVYLPCFTVEMQRMIPQDISEDLAKKEATPEVSRKEAPKESLTKKDSKENKKNENSNNKLENFFKNFFHF